MALMAVVDATAVVEHGRATVAVPLAQQPRGMIAPHGGARMTTPTDRPRRRVGRIARGALAAVALLNVALVGSEEQVREAFATAG